VLQLDGSVVSSTGDLDDPNLPKTIFYLLQDANAIIKSKKTTLAVLFNVLTLTSAFQIPTKRAFVAATHSRRSLATKPLHATPPTMVIY